MLFKSQRLLVLEPFLALEHSSMTQRKRLKGKNLKTVLKSTLKAGIWIVFWFLMIVQIVAAKAQAGFR